MLQEFNEDGLSFRYPAGWKLEHEPNEEGWTVTVQSPGTAYMVVRLDRSLRTTPEEMLEATLKTMKQEFPTLEAEATMETLAGELAFGHDMEFFSLDMVITAWTRSFHGMAGTIFVLCQVAGLDEQTYEPVLRAMCASMHSSE